MVYAIASTSSMRSICAVYGLNVTDTVWPLYMLMSLLGSATAWEDCNVQGSASLGLWELR